MDSKCSNKIIKLDKKKNRNTILANKSLTNNNVLNVDSDISEEEPEIDGFNSITAKSPKFNYH